MTENLSKKIASTSHIKPNEVVLYHGSVEELNKLGRHRYGILTDNMEYVSGEKIPFPEISMLTLPIRKELLRRGFHGLVNRRTIYAGKEEINKGEENSERNYYRIEGTPVVILDDSE